MLDFHRKKDTSILGAVTQRDSSFLNFDQSKNLYDFILKHDNQMKQMETEILNLKSQLIDITTKIPLVNSNNISNYEAQSLKIKEEIKSDIIKDINDIITTTNRKYQGRN